MEYWRGRTDGEKANQLRWHQIVKSCDEVEDFAGEFVILGFESEEGVIRNLGRPGAIEGPQYLRQNMSSFPAHSLQRIWDAGNIRCENHDLEGAQKKLENKIIDIYARKGKSFVLGGGHSITFPHYKALREYFKEQKIGIINFDAHFDNRKINSEIGATSGTGFYQIAQEGPIHSLHLGIQRNSNTLELFEYAEEHQMQYVEAKDCHAENELLFTQIDAFIEKIDLLYVTICLDVFAASVAPGVSALAYNGLFNDHFFYKTLRYILANNKLQAFDIAELNPSFDIDNRTAKLAASLAFELMMRNQ